MDRKLPIYTLVLNEDGEDSGIDFVALVDAPAIERNWFAFKEEKPFKFVTNEERKIVTGALMIADLPIYRRDNELGEYYVVFDKSQIETMVQRFMKKGFQNNVNEMHDASKKVEGVSMFESFIVDSERGVSAPRGFEGVPEGSWFGSYKVDNEEIWGKVKSGEFMGFSVEGMFKPVPQEETLESEILNIIKDIQE